MPPPEPAARDFKLYQDVDSNVFVDHLQAKLVSVYGNVEMIEADLVTIHATNTDIVGVVGITGDVTIRGETDITGKVTLVGDVGVTGATSVSIHATKTDIVGNVGVTGATSISIHATKTDVVSDVGVTGHVTIRGETDITGKVSLVGDVGVTGNVDVSGDINIKGGDLILNDISLGQYVSSAYKPLCVSTRQYNPESAGLAGQAEPPGSINVLFRQDQAPYYTNNFFSGWAYNSSVTPGKGGKINWFFPPGSATTTVANFKGFNVNIQGYSNKPPFVVVYTKPTGTNDYSWYKSCRVYVASNLNQDFSTLKYNGSQLSYNYSLIHNDYSPSLVSGYTPIETTVDNDTSHGNFHDNEEIMAYTLQTGSGETGYAFIANSFTFTETQTQGTHVTETSFLGLLPSV